MVQIIRSFALILCAQVALAGLALAGNDTVFLKSHKSVYQETPINVEQITAVPSYLSNYNGEEFQPVEIFVNGSTSDNEDFRGDAQIVGLQVEGSGVYASVITATYAGELYFFTSLRALQLGQAEAVVGDVSELGVVTLYSAYRQESALVNYNPTVMDKIMSWIISAGGRVTQADEWLEFKVIEKK